MCIFGHPDLHLEVSALAYRVTASYFSSVTCDAFRSRSSWVAKLFGSKDDYDGSTAVSQSRLASA